MKKIKILTITLTIILITMIAFFGVYTQVQNRMENQVKENSYAMDLTGSRNIRLVVNTESTTTVKDADGNVVEDADDLTDEEIAEKGYVKEETPYNSEEIKNAENYKLSQKIIEKRLKKLGVENYIIKLDEQTGDIVIEIPENDNTDSIVSNINTMGKFEIIDTETEEVLMDNSDIKLSQVLYGSSSSTTSSGTSVYLDIEFNKEGTKKLEEISKKYVEVEESEDTEDTEDTEAVDETEEVEEETDTDEETTTEKTITMKIDDEEIMSTSFDETIENGKLQLSIGSSTTDTDTLKGYADQATSMATVLDTGNIPVKYDLDENQYILSDITANEMQIAMYIVLGIIAVALVVLVIRYKSLGILGTISYIGLVSLLMIVIRYTNVVLSIEGLFGMVVIFALNYILVSKLLAKANNRAEVYKEFFIKIIPIIILAITFCFISWTPISSFGMVIFWGIVLIAFYNGIVTNNLLKINARKEK
jgi:preprotein translocase subunit SecD